MKQLKVHRHELYTHRYIARASIQFVKAYMCREDVYIRRFCLVRARGAPALLVYSYATLPSSSHLYMSQLAASHGCVYILHSSSHVWIYSIFGVQSAHVSCASVHLLLPGAFFLSSKGQANSLARSSNDSDGK